MSAGAAIAGTVVAVFAPRLPARDGLSVSNAARFGAQASKSAYCVPGLRRAATTAAWGRRASLHTRLLVGALLTVCKRTVSNQPPFADTIRH